MTPGKSGRGKVIAIVVLAAMLLGGGWFVRNLIVYNNCWEGLSPAVRDEWESTGESGGNPFFDFIRHGLDSGCPAGLEALQEPQISIQELRDAVRLLQTDQNGLKAEVEEIKSRFKKQEEAGIVSETENQK